MSTCTRTATKGDRPILEVSQSAKAFLAYAFLKAGDLLTIPETACSPNLRMIENEALHLMRRFNALSD
jgi:hypothetical protein